MKETKTKTNDNGFLAKAKNNIGKTLKQTPPIIYGGVVSLAVLGLVAMYGLSVIKSSDCGGSLSFESSQTTQKFQFRKESCQTSANK